ncbi:PGF-pre-PGF domain-containing protein [Halorubrum ezzemoulense]|uniref:PGF-pre-PGF domain-containing protein n=1 Tax=Halorubrum ezzemoulense TaxID=337243 RepID=UPI00232EE8AA|nr:PGF-pre-PGF domain-containing protein [Halorubrum ezzemoulense]MDB9249357.1 PGF-pre-PGF domain-containing protein [Halorubrum ezzemoulense]MDB9262060.1 PGF-pre-PGF domain-containing protein [Halorubrum ezzemoulense]MDB9265563.1 PGF-pre-PGF domain-containing protein [Halorubrum ezzemoulense]MDB9291268.1 PGF-pre-PGF domain-containing protein [Halorubrum ezzemoulense]MDB9292354.1 PGF-pre-PGF domain-containing protein [Halorubrum ezzemoulense]
MAVQVGNTELSEKAVPVVVAAYDAELTIPDEAAPGETVNATIELEPYDEEPAIDSVELVLMDGDDPDRIEANATNPSEDIYEAEVTVPESEGDYTVFSTVFGEESLSESEQEMLEITKTSIEVTEDAADDDSDDNNNNVSDPDDGNETNTSDPDDGTETNVTDPDDGNETNVTDPDDGNETNVTDPDDGNETNVTDPDDGNETNVTDPDDGNETNITDPDDGNETNVTDPDDGNETNVTDPDDGNETNTSDPDDGNETNTSDPDEGDSDDVGTGGGAPDGDGSGDKSDDGEGESDEGSGDTVTEVVQQAQATAESDAETGGARATFDEGSPVEEIDFKSDVEGTVNVTTRESEPADVEPPSGTAVQVSEITVPEDARNSPATIRMTVDTARLEEHDATAEELRVERFSDGTWESLETTVVDAGNDRVVLEAETPGFSMFAVTAEEDAGDDGSTSTDGDDDSEDESTGSGDDDGSTGTDGEDDSDDGMTEDDTADASANGSDEVDDGSEDGDGVTEDDTPGFGVLGALVAVTMLAAAAVTRNRRSN